MKTRTTKLFAAMTVAIATTYGVSDVSKSFAANPTIEQKLVDKIVLSNKFLEEINYIPVDEKSGEKVVGSVPGMVAKRTDTDATDRQTSDVLNLGTKGYECHDTEYDVHIKYATMDSWAKFADFEERFLMYVRKAIATSKVKVGWYGESVARPSNVGANPNGEDVNKGWFQHLREYNSASQVISEGGVANEVRFGSAANHDFINLDSMAHNLLQLVHEEYRQGDDLVVFIGKDLLALERDRLYKALGDKPTEKQVAEVEAVVSTFAGLPAETPPYFPGYGMLITSKSNMSVYYQEGSVRQQIENNAKRNRIEHYNSVNEAYVLEDEEKAAMIEFKNVKIHDGTNWVSPA